MASMSVALDASDGPYNFHKILSGQVTTGVTQKTGSGVRPGIGVNCSRLIVFIDDVVAGVARISTGIQADTTNLIGRQLLPGESTLYSGEGNDKAISLLDKWIDVDTDAMVVIFEYE